MTKDLFKKILIFYLVSGFVYGAINYFTFDINYHNIEDQLHQGYLKNFFSLQISSIILGALNIVQFISFILLFFFIKFSRILFLSSTLIIITFITLDGDYLVPALTYPFEIIDTFLEMFIIYLIFLTPLKEEFNK